MPSQPTTIAGRFDVERAVGRGGMGTVWLCRDRRLGRQVAVKQVGLLPGESRTQLGRALREARSSAALNHPNVVAVYDAVEEGDHAWLVMEYVPSRTLQEIVTADGPLTPELAARVGAQAADGLAAAHAQGIVHRDVKPSNVLVTDAGQVKITDFGIARTHGQEALTRTGIVMGTPGYFSPELAKGEEPQPTADVWALGATLFTAVEGRSPYPEQGNALATLARIATDPPPRPTRAGVLAEPIARMMDPDPSSRWTMDEAARELHRLQDRLPVDGDGDRTLALPLGLVDTEENEHPVAPATPAEPEVVAPVAAPAPVPGRRPTRSAASVRSCSCSRSSCCSRWSRAGWCSGCSRATTTSPRPPAPRRPPGAPTGRRGPSAPAAPATTAPPEDEPSEPAPEPEPEETESEPRASRRADRRPGRLRDAATTGCCPATPARRTPCCRRTTRPARRSPTTRASGARSRRSSVRDTRVVDDTTVDVDITYTGSDGATEDETRRLYLEPAGDGWVIADDEAV